MHHHWPSHHRNFPSPLPNALQLPSDLIDCQLDFAFAAGAGSHKCKFGRRHTANSAVIPRLALAHGLDSLNADDNPFANLQVPQKASSSDRMSTFMVIDHDAAIHSLSSHPHPLPVNSHLCWINRGDIKIVRSHSVCPDPLQTCVPHLLRDSG